MTKLLSVRVILAVDDEIGLAELKPRLQRLIGQGGTEHIEGDGQGPRIHWSTVDVLQGPEQRTPPVTRRGKKAAAGSSTGTGAQPDLIQ
jgi:hypothetical protein